MYPFEHKRIHKMNFIKLTGLSLLLASTSVVALPDLDDSDVRDDVDIRAFEIGDDGDVANLFYVVDRTTKNCFVVARDKRPGGIAPVSCDSLTAIPLIKQYIETGSIDDGSN